MPAKTATSSLAGKLGVRGKKAHDAHKADETRMGIIELPPGIRDGVARLITAEWKEHPEGHDNAGEPFINFQAIVRHPVEFKGENTKNRRATKFIPLYDTPNRKQATMEEHYDELLNELRKLGVDTAKITVAQVEAALKALTKARPYTKFSTTAWTPKKTPDNPNPDTMTFTNYDGKCAWEESTGDGVEDHTEEEGVPVDEEGNDIVDLVALGEAGDEEDQEAQRKLTELAVAKGIDPNDYAKWAEVASLLLEGGGEATPDAEPTTSEGGDPAWLRAQGVEGDREDADAQTALTERGEPLGLSDVDYATWVEFAEAIIEKEAEPAETPAETPAAEAPADFTPVKGEIYFHKGNECEVTLVSPTKKIVNLKNLEDGKPIKSVPWTELEG